MAHATSWPRRCGARALLVTLLLAGAGCARTTEHDVSGVDAPVVYGKSGEACGRGLVLIQTDYISTNLALLDFDAHILSESVIHSGAGAVQLNAPLGGDVVYASGLDNELILIDRYPASVATFVDIRSAEVRGQINLRTGFDSNPRDLLVLDDQRALVSRYETNRTPGRQPMDEGDDLLIIDIANFTILERIELDESKDARSRPSALLRAGADVVVSLARLNSSFSEADDAELVILDGDDLSERDRILLDGMQVCEGLALSPSGDALAVVCSAIVDKADQAKPTGSGLIFFEKDDEGAWVEAERHLAADWALGPLGFSVAFGSEDQVLFTSFGALEGRDAGRPDRLLTYDRSQQSLQIVVETDPFNLGSVTCSQACERCYSSNAQANLVYVLDVEDQFSKSEISVNTAFGLPPRSLGIF